MTPQERDLIVQLLDRLKQAGGQTKDPEADALIRRAVAEQPDAPYYLVQTILIQDMALANAQNRINELEKRVAGAQQASQPTSFLGGLLGRGSAPAAGGAPAAGPWGRPAAPAAQQGGPWGGQPAAPQQGQPMAAAPMMQPSALQGASGGFLRQAAATAAGIAGGALLFQGIQSMFGPHAGGILGGAGMQPGLSETVINNYYGSDPAAPGGAPDLQTASYEPGGAADSGNWADPNTDLAGTDNPMDTTDFASDSGFGGDDNLT